MQPLMLKYFRFNKTLYKNRMTILNDFFTTLIFLVYEKQS